MKFPRIYCAVAGFAALLILAACAMGGGGHRFNQQPPPPPTGNNYTTCSGQLVPNWLSPVFQQNYKPAIAALVTHYGGNPNVGYIRVGLGRGGEINLPQGWNQQSSGSCFGGYSTKWGYSVGDNAGFTWNNYLKTMVDYEGSLNSPKKLVVSITPVTGGGIAVDDFIAPIAVANNMGFGNQGLEKSDISDYPNCGGDWCNLFAQYPTNTPRELQTLGQSCPTGTTCISQQSADTGPLDPLIPFATAHNANDLELYYEDWLIAYNSTYAAQVGASASSAAYKAAIESVPGNVSMQVLFPPAGAGDPDFGFVQQSLLNNPHVSGFVIAVQWSDFDLGNGNYDFSIPDHVLSLYPGKTINLVLQDTTYGGGSACPNSSTGSNGNEPSNCAVPPYMWTLLAK